VGRRDGLRHPSSPVVTAFGEGGDGLDINKTKDKKMIRVSIWRINEFLMRDANHISYILYIKAKSLSEVP
jgi:hypothetical protein